eukprot:CAMPEP_0117739492 /NCGR_PEP_ID=MMETSP0947-20121206/3780_1 /TAXON_ID=44440 /ORGANISM="Chattonella subsalsa, Strain CCMP2191" /LENGTH=376 /DNA_ID=CAMNT_0005555429 /DNA_START=42 /DNA_END=1172 /DNA_ORIENTATION=+
MKRIGFFLWLFSASIQLDLIASQIEVEGDECASKTVEAAKKKPFAASIDIFIDENEKRSLFLSLFNDLSAEFVAQDFCDNFLIEPKQLCKDRTTEIIKEVDYLLYLELVESLKDFLKCYGLEIASRAEPDLAMLPKKGQFIRNVAQQPEVQTICEIGFGGGHNALAFLAANSKVNVVSFDVVPNRGEGVAIAAYAAEFLNSLFPERFFLVAGTPNKTVPSFKSFAPEVKCDLLLVDGLHTYDETLSGMTNFAGMARGQHLLMVDDVNWEGVYKAWSEVTAGGVQELFVVSDSQELFKVEGSLTACARSTLEVSNIEQEENPTEEATDPSPSYLLKVVAGSNWKPGRPALNLEECTGEPIMVQSALAVGVYTFQPQQ